MRVTRTQFSKQDLLKTAARLKDGLKDQMLNPDRSRSVAAITSVHVDERSNRVVVLRNGTQFDRSLVAKSTLDRVAETEGAKVVVMDEPELGLYSKVSTLSPKDPPGMHVQPHLRGGSHEGRLSPRATTR